MKPNVAVIIQGGCVREVVSDMDLNLTIIDMDIEGSEPSNTSSVEGLEDEAFVGSMMVDVSPEFMKQFAVDGQ